MLIDEGSDWLLGLLVSLASLVLVVATLPTGMRRRAGRIAGFGLGMAVGAAALVGLAAIAVRVLAGPQGLASIIALIPAQPAPSPPLPNVVRPTPRREDPRPAPQEANAHSGRVTRVRDGDTIEVAGVPIRFAHVDCAERGTAAGDAATRAMRELASGRQVQCSLIGRRSYDREIGTCYLPDGRDLGAVLVARGLCAWW